MSLASVPPPVHALAMSRIRAVKPDWVASQFVDADDRVPNYGPTMVYAFYDANDGLLYVGVTGRPAERWTDHRRSEWWPFVATLETVWAPSMYAALSLERTAIRDFKPAYNIRSA